MKTKQFDLSQAVAGKIVVDEDGRTGKWIYSMINSTSAHLGKVHIFSFRTEEGREYLVSADYKGNAVLTKEFTYKGILCMQCEEKEYHIATGISSQSQELYSTRPYIFEEQAISNLRNSIHLIEDTLQTHKIIRYE